MPEISIDQVDAVLPQTQCGLCGYGGCRPYAEAMVKQQEAINRCPPGGIATLKQLGALFSQDPTPYMAGMPQKPFAVAKIREAECIGCTKCIQACPVDAIIGSGKVLHSILQSECTGCELCVAPCPVDCIEIETLSERGYNRAKARSRFNAKQARLSSMMAANTHPQPYVSNKKAELMAAVARAKAKRINKP